MFCGAPGWFGRCWNGGGMVDAELELGGPRMLNKNKLILPYLARISLRPPNHRSTRYRIRRIGGR